MGVGEQLGRGVLNHKYWLSGLKRTFFFSRHLPPFGIRSWWRQDIVYRGQKFELHMEHEDKIPHTKGK